MLKKKGFTAANVTCVRIIENAATFKTLSIILFKKVLFSFLAFQMYNCCKAKIINSCSQPHRPQVAQLEKEDRQKPRKCLSFSPFPKQS